MDEPLNKLKEVFSQSKKKALEEYNEKEKEKTIKIYKGIILFLSVINLISIVFYFIYTFQLKSMDRYISNISNDISSNEITFKKSRESFDHQLVKLYSDIRTDLRYLSELIQTPEEYAMLIKWLPQTQSSESQKRLFFCYKSVADGLEPTTFREQCSYDNNLLIIIETEDGKRFGGFVEIDWGEVNDDTYISDQNAFLFSMDDKQQFKVNDGNYAFKMLSKGFFMFGQEDIVVEDQYENDLRGYVKFPKSYQGNKALMDQEYFMINGIEIFNYVEFSEEYYY